MKPQCLSFLTREELEYIERKGCFDCTDCELPYRMEQKMKLREWMSYNIYKKLWSLVGNRPWTYILRDVYHRYEFIWIVALVAVGVWIGHHFDWLEVLKIMGIFTIGYIFGHLFWGKKWIPSQKPD